MGSRRLLFSGLSLSLFLGNHKLWDFTRIPHVETKHACYTWYTDGLAMSISRSWNAKFILRISQPPLGYKSSPFMWRSILYWKSHLEVINYFIKRSIFTCVRHSRVAVLISTTYLAPNNLLGLGLMYTVNLVTLLKNIHQRHCGTCEKCIFLFKPSIVA